MSLLSEISTLTARTAVFIQIHSCSFAKFAASFFDLRLSAKNLRQQSWYRIIHGDVSAA
jgi:hypothetical protein